MKLRLLGLALVAVASSLPASAHKLTREQLTLFFGKDDRVAVGPSGMPWQTIGRLQTLGGLQCTATLVAPDVALTAGHCFVNPRGQLDPAQDFTIGLQGERYAKRVTITKVMVNRQLLRGLIHKRDGVYVPESVARYDYAFVRLSEPLGNTYGYLPVFGGDRTALKKALAGINKRMVHVGYPEDTQGILMAHKNCLATELHRDGRLGHRCDTLPGDSGSPMLATVDGKTMIIAIQSSAPNARDRYRADNMSLTAPVFYNSLQRFIQNK
ncbi:MAG: trypsin-like serine protease [Paludibacterium sp.]|uniref:trypsin-like serine peptidase n=1 Tax=Paludibacterium sp. TaxID=1917523 RepID=UPI0026002EE3|nr:trypsin-like serine protease [Paludibacterium sp.]MBV8047362.1 trypsin-like serine protease [Paludibacterium sp.]MBV8646287.1 trypsin-like serine protease [Paludibacterium sp.]